MPRAAYSPDDARITPAALDFLRSAQGRALRDAVAALPDPSHPAVNDVSRLRNSFPPEPLHAAIVLCALQPKARGKFPNHPFVWSTPEALQQATAFAVAQYKAAQFRAPSNHPAAGAPPIWDLCAGIGGDTLALADIGPVSAVELSPLRAMCLRFNAADQSPPPGFPIRVLAADATEILPALEPHALVHIDPARRWHDARRATTRRSPRYEDLIPGPDFLDALFARVAGGCVKLSPAVDFDDLPSPPRVPDCRLELISHNRSVVQALLWRGTLARQAPPGAPALRTATILSDHHPPWSFHGVPAPFTTTSTPLLTALLAGTLTTGAFLLELDGALTRAGLAAPFAALADLAPLTPDGGYLLATSPQSPRLPPHAQTALTPFRLVALVPFTRQAVTATLRRLPPAPRGPVEVKSRGLPHLDTDALQRTWSAAAPFGRTVLLFRGSDRVLAAIAQRP